MFDLGKALARLGSATCHAEAEMLASAHSLVAHIHKTISEIDAQPADLRQDLARTHDRLLTDIISWCAAHLRKAPKQPRAGDTSTLGQVGEPQTGTQMKGSGTTTDGASTISAEQMQAPADPTELQNATNSASLGEPAAEAVPQPTSSPTPSIYG